MVAPYRAQTYALRRRLVNSTPLDRSRLIGSYIQVAQGLIGSYVVTGHMAAHLLWPVHTGDAKHP